jgi:hypothetical protein
MKWEYEFATGVFTSIDDLQERLNALGRSGWEAIGVTQPTETRDDITVLLKRRHRPHRQSEKGKPFEKRGITTLEVRT